MPEKPQEERRRLVYGVYWLHDCFALLDETLAKGLADEIGAIQTCATVGQARKLEPTLKFTWVPGSDFEDDDGEPLPDDASYVWSETAAATEGDWPSMPDAIALDDLPVELRSELVARAGAEVLHTTLNGPYFAIPLDREADMVSVLQSAGYEVHRDDGLIASLGMEA